ncbi:shikimate dehydrogenase family protein [Pacificibacter marinus]|uniref:shikimate dehydrogenase family protein n=1 Tax=Pacificibacter marinus TaxID=658057 RepID=UPI001C07490E|nr:shikimate dehydrogenase [Pacificibacter marinus]MBU2867800.1 shikimate dehydrogenase [Pacificibacter marinus]
MITGRTKLLAIIADPVTQVRTPQAMNAMLSDMGKDAVLVPVEVSREGLAAVVSGFRNIGNFAGVVVTVPHKTAVPPLCDTLSDRAIAAGAVNVIRRDAQGKLHGDILDGEGFTRGLDDAKISVTGMAVFLVGAGGAASAIAFALASRGPKKITISNRTRAKAQALSERLSESFPDVEFCVGDDPSGHDLAVNGTSLGMAPNDALPFDPAGLSSGSIVAEVIMQPEVTPLLAAAEQLGFATHGGRKMLQGQLSELAKFLTQNMEDTQ